MTRLHRLGITATITGLIFCTAIAQNVGIGLSNPNHKLTIQSTNTSILRLIGPGTAGAEARLTFGDPTFCFIEEDEDDHLTIYADNRTAIMGGNVGIGTMNPVSKLDVAGVIHCGSEGYGYIQTGLTTSIATYVDEFRGWFGTTTDHPIWFYTGNGNAATMVIEDAGNKNVGIGTTAPTSKLEILDGHTTASALRVIKNYSPGGNANVPAIYGENVVDDYYGIGVYGKGGYVGVYGDSDQDGGNENYFGVYARAHGTNTGTNVGVAGLGETGINTYGLFGVASGSNNNFAVYGQASGGSFNYAGYFLGDVSVSSTSFDPGTISVKSYSAGAMNNAAGVFGQNTVDNGYGIGVIGQGGLTGVHGFVHSTGDGPYKGILGEAIGFSQSNIGIHGTASNALFNIGIKGEAHSASGFDNYGLRGEASGASSTNGGVLGVASGDNGIKMGVQAQATGPNTNYAIYAFAGGGAFNYAGYFASGNVYVGDNLGIGDDPGAHKLVVHHGSKGLKIQHTSAGASFWELLQVGELNGNLQLWNTAAMSVGNFNYASGAYSATSDRRLKENIQPMTSVLSKVMELQASSYTYKADTDQKPCLGFIAQDVEQIFPQLVTPPTTDGERETVYTMDYSGFGVLAIKAIQEQQEIIDEQEKRIAKLEVLVGELLKKGEQQVQPEQ